MKTFPNGYVMIANKQEEGSHAGKHQRIIIALSPNGMALHPYVVAHYTLGDTEWYWGTYYRTIEEAVADYTKR